MSKEIELKEDKAGNLFQKCSCCGIWRTAEEKYFYKDDNTSTGLKGKCKDCCKEYYRKNRLYRLNYQNKYNESKGIVHRSNNSYNVPMQHERKLIEYTV